MDLVKPSGFMPQGATVSNMPPKKGSKVTVILQRVKKMSKGIWEAHVCACVHAHTPILITHNYNNVSSTYIPISSKAAFFISLCIPVPKAVSGINPML